MAKPMSDEERNAALRSYRESADTMLQLLVAQAPLIRAKFNALVKEGFTEAQAIELCKGALLQ